MVYAIRGNEGNQSIYDSFGLILGKNVIILHKYYLKKEL
jgi:hypothetical protein